MEDNYFDVAQELVRMQHFGYEPGLAERVQVEITKRVEPTCIDCDTILLEGEEEEGRCCVCSEINAIDIAETGRRPY